MGTLASNSSKNVYDVMLACESLLNGAVTTSIASAVQSVEDDALLRCVD